MWAGKLMAEELRDPSIIHQAALNVLLIDAVVRRYVLMEILGKTSTGAFFTIVFEYKIPARYLGFYMNLEYPYMIP